MESLKDITLKIGSGATPRGGSEAYHTEGVSLVRSLNVYDDGFREKDLAFLDEAQADRLSNAELERGDVLLNITGASIARCCVLPEQVLPARVNQHVSIVRADPTRLNPFYLRYQLISPQHKKALLELARAGGSTREALTKAQIEAYQVSVPSLAEQQRIVTKLDVAFAALAEAQANVERNRANARELFESYLNGVFEGERDEWVTMPLSEFIHVKHGFAFLGEHFTKAGDHVLLTMGNFYEHGGYRDRGEKQKFYVGPVPEEFVLSKGDLAVAMTEQAAGLLGAPLLVPESGKFLHNQRVGLVQQPNGVVVHNEFLFHIFNTKPFRDAVHASGSGVKVRHTSPTKIGDVEVSYPTSLKEQKRIVDALASLKEETKQLETTYEQKLTELEGLKKGLLGAAFRGEL